MLAIAGMAFVMFRIQASSEQINFSRFNTVTWILAFSLSFIYGVANFMPALAWRHLLKYFSVNVNRKWVIQTYGISQLARYVPGNIFHLAGRHILGIVAGIPGIILAKSIFWELVLISLTSILFGLLLLPLFIPSIKLEMLLLIFIIMNSLVIFIIWHWIGAVVAKAASWYIVFLAITSIVFVSLFTLIVPNDHSVILLISMCGAYVIAWLAGLVTPGAPAGMGVRELILLLLLDGSVVEVDLLLVIVLGRIVTWVGIYYFMLRLLYHQNVC